MLVNGTSLESPFSYPSHIEDYTIIAQIGKGAFGTVFEAQIAGRRVAIKALDKSTIRQSSLALRVRNEVAIHYQLRHRNVLELLHFFEDAEHVFMVMELAAGGELYQRIRRGPKLKDSEIRRIFGTIVEGVSYLHSHGIIHRDLKLSNILLSRDLTPKIADFGLAVKIDENHDCEQQTLCGTPNYLAPEVILKRPYGKAADLWSLGCLLYTIIVGRPPFESSDVRDTFKRVSRGDFLIPQDVSTDARDLISRLIVVDPSRRISLEQIKRHPYLRPAVPLFSKEPLNTFRLKAIKQRTRHGWVQILVDGRLVVDFVNENDILVISGDGKLLQLYRKPWKPEYGSYLLEQANYAEIPANMASRYEYGRRFVNLVRSKTPQVALVTDALKAFLMSNPSPHDFQLRYNSGLRIDYFPSLGTLLIKRTDGSEKRFDNFNPNAMEGILPMQDRLAANECFFRYKQCCEAALRVASNQESYPFPYIIRENSDFQGEITAPQISTLVSTSMATMASLSPRTCADADRSFEYAYKTYIPDVGWCLASPAEQFLLLFADGQTVLIDGRRNRVAYHDRRHGGDPGAGGLGAGGLGSGDTLQHWLDIDQQLPSELKRKLLYFPKFVNLLKNGNGHSFVS